MKKSTEPQLYDRGVYTLVKLPQLDDWFDENGSVQTSQGKNWKAAAEMVRDADLSDQVVPIFFSNADSVGALYYWAILRDVRAGKDGSDFTFDTMRWLRPVPATSELTVASTGRPMSTKQISPYVICKTPKPGTPMRGLMEDAPNAEECSDLLASGSVLVGLLIETDTGEISGSVTATVTKSHIYLEWTIRNDSNRPRYFRGTVTASSKDGTSYSGTWGRPTPEPGFQASLKRKRNRDGSRFLFELNLKLPGQPNDSAIIKLWHVDEMPD